MARTVETDLSWFKELIFDATYAVVDDFNRTQLVRFSTDGLWGVE